MRKLWPVLLLALAGAPEALAGSTPFATGDCTIQSINPAVGSSGSDTDCVFNPGTWYKFQCDATVYYRSDGTNPTTNSPKVSFPGEPEPFVAKGDARAGGTIQPLKVLAASGTANCVVFIAD